MIDIHDNEVQAYTVDLADQTIRLDTTWSYKEHSERTRIEFRGVMAHYLVGANNWQNVLFSIEEEPLEALLSEFGALLEEQKNTGWPCIYEDKGDLLRQLREQQMVCYRICDSIGLNGWVLAREMEFIPLNYQAQEARGHFDIK